MRSLLGLSLQHCDLPSYLIKCCGLRYLITVMKITLTQSRSEGTQRTPMFKVALRASEMLGEYFYCFPNQLWGNAA